jgi:dolichol-phosphate mannosyltransferase
MMKRLNAFTDLVIDSSYGPIKAMSRLGFVVAILGFAWLVTIVIKYFIGGTPFNGWAPIMVTILLLGGFIMIMLGIVGEYLWRIHDQVRERPMHVVLESEFAEDTRVSESPVKQDQMNDKSGK